MADNDKQAEADMADNDTAANEPSSIAKLSISQGLEVEQRVVVARRMLEVAVEIPTSQVATLDSQIALAENELRQARMILGESLMRRVDTRGE